MSATEKELQTISYYDQHAEKWSSERGPDAKKSLWEPELEQFHSLLPEGKILEIGFGGAKEAASLIRMGYEYVGIDPAAALIKKAQKRFSQAQFDVKSVYDLDYKQVFDGFWCSAVLLHVPPEKMNSALSKIYQSMKPGALGFISLIQGQGEYLDEETGRFFYLYDEDQFITLLKKNGFIIERHNIRHRNTKRTWLRSWLTFFVRVK